MFLGLNQQNVGFVGSTSQPSLRTVSFAYTANMQTWTVPNSVQSVTGRLWGPGGVSPAGATVFNGAKAGTGGYCAMGFNVTPGSVLNIVVGSAFDRNVPSLPVFGSGRSEIAYNGILLVAGGGGGAGIQSFGGFTMVAAGGNGGMTGTAGATVGGGQGGQTLTGGVGGVSPGGVTGGNGIFHLGGAGVSSGSPFVYSGGHGGGGFFGGGGGGASTTQCGGGGGGSSVASGGYNIVITGFGANWNNDPYWDGSASTPNSNGRVVLTYWGTN